MTAIPPDASSTAPTTTASPHSPEAEGKHHTYVGHTVPWYVWLLWSGFWILCIAYILIWLVPALKVEIVTPP